MKELQKYVDVSLLEKRFKGEVSDLREFITPTTLSVRKIAERLNFTPLRCFRWVVEEITYPWSQKFPAWSMIFADLHVLFRHPPTPKLSINFFDFWKFPYETIRDGKGDCEDGAFLCTSLIRACLTGSADFRTRPCWAVIGYVRIDGVNYGHAWCEYDNLVLETTLDKMPEYIPTTEEVYEKLYFPETKFNDQETIRICRAGGRGSPYSRALEGIRDFKRTLYSRLKKLRKLNKLHKLIKDPTFFPSSLVEKGQTAGVAPASQQQSRSSLVFPPKTSCHPSGPPG